MTAPRPTADTGRNPVAPRLEWCDHGMSSHGQHGCEESGCPCRQRGFSVWNPDGPHPTAATVDIELLKRVMFASGRFVGGELAVEEIATEYARLSSAPTEPPAPPPLDVDLLRDIRDWMWWGHADVCDHYDPCQCGWSSLNKRIQATLEPDDADPNRAPPAPQSAGMSSDTVENDG